jgi:hypothetical protein
MNKRDLRKLRKLLPKGYSIEIAKSCLCSATTVRMVLTGKRPDYYNIIESAILLAETNKKNKESQVNKLKNVLNENS